MKAGESTKEGDTITADRGPLLMLAGHLVRVIWTFLHSVSPYYWSLLQILSLFFCTLGNCNVAYWSAGILEMILVYLYLNRSRTLDLGARQTYKNKSPTYFFAELFFLYVLD